MFRNTHSQKHTIAGLAFAALLLIANTADARTYAPRIVSEHNADAYSMKTFAQHPRWRDLSGDAKAWEMFSYLTDYRTGLYPMGLGAYEGTEELYEYSLVRDPIKAINVYSVGYCDVFGPVMAGIWEGAGFGKARVVDVPYFDHVATEVFYDNSWHYLDLDLRAAFRRNDGSLASIQASQSESSLWDRENGPRFFPQDNVNDMRGIYEASSFPKRYNVSQSGHTMDFTLRQGETFTRWWQPQGGRWSHHQSYEDDFFTKQLIETEPRGPKSKHESFTKHTYGNGRFLYSPDLRQQSTDFIDGVYDSQNIVPGPNGLTLSTSGSGYAVFEVRTPYVIVPTVGETSTTNDDFGASVVELNATGASYSLSLDNGITWQPVYGSYIDLTEQVAGKYGYLFKIELNGEPELAAVRSLKMTTWVQLAPASLPSLRQGSNRFEFRTGDHYGLKTKVMEIQPETSSREELYKHLVVEPSSYTPETPWSRIHGPFVVAVVPPPATKIAWFSAGASFQTDQMEYAPFSTFTMDYARDVPFSFNNIHTTNMPADMSHWHTNAQEEIYLNNPADAVYVRYEGEPGVNYVRIYAHVIDDNPRPASPVRITHEWLENGQLRNFSTTSTNSGSEYYINVNGVADNVSIEMAVDSQYESQPPAAVQSLATISWPPEGYTVANNSVIYFSLDDTSFDEWRMTVGSNSNAQGLFDSGIKYSNLDPPEQILSFIPSNGQPVTLRFWQRNTGGQWATFDTTYATESNTPAPPLGVATITWLPLFYLLVLLCLRQLNRHH